MASKLKNAGIALAITGGLAVGGYYIYDQNTESEQPIETNITNVTHSDVKSINIKEEQRSFNLPANIGGQIIVRDFYTLSHNSDANQAEWIAYTMLPYKKNDSVKRKNNFKKDSEVLVGASELADYKSASDRFDRGHLAPAESMNYTQKSMDESFFLSNMSPQMIGFNRGIWKKIETEVREWSKQSDSLYVVSGPVLDNPLDSIGSNSVFVPRAYYKTIIRFQDEEMTGIAFLINHEKSSKDVTTFLTSIDSVEQVTGINFYHQLDSLIQAKLEKNKDVNEFIGETN